MLISRVSVGIMMIGASIFLFLIASLTNDPEVAMGVEERTFAVNFFFLIAAVLVGVGIRLAFLVSPAPCAAKNSDTPQPTVTISITILTLHPVDETK